MTNRGPFCPISVDTFCKIHPNLCILFIITITITISVIFTIIIVLLLLLLILLLLLLLLLISSLDSCTTSPIFLLIQALRLKKTRTKTKAKWTVLRQIKSRKNLTNKMATLCAKVPIYRVKVSTDSDSKGTNLLNK